MRLLFLAISSIFFMSAAHAQISKSDMLNRIDKDRVSFNRAPLVNTPSQITEKMLERQRARYPKFKDSMWYYAYVKENGYSNIIHYDWSADECFYLVFNEDALKKKSKDVVRFVQSGGSDATNDARRDKIPMKYCEKVYNFYSDKKE